MNAKYIFFKYILNNFKPSKLLKKIHSKEMWLILIVSELNVKENE